MEHAAQRRLDEELRGSGGQGLAPEPRFLIVGLVIGAHGIRGELKVDILTDDPHRFASLDRVFLGAQDQEPAPWVLKGYRLHGGRALLQIDGCRDRTTAETYRGQLVQVPLGEALPLDEGEYFEHQIEGLQVWTGAGDFLGEVVEIIFTGANQVYVVRGQGPKQKELLIPAIKDVVLKVDIEAGRLVVELPEGLA